MERSFATDSSNQDQKDFLTMTLKLVFFVGVVSLGIEELATGSANADTSSLFGNTLICTSYQIPRFPQTRTLYFTKNNVLQYDSDPNKTSKFGIIYDFSQDRSGSGSGDFTYQTYAPKINLTEIELKNTASHTCGICDGHRISRSEQFLISFQDNKWTSVLHFRQWLTDGAQPTVPSGSDVYTCKLIRGRHGVGK